VPLAIGEKIRDIGALWSRLYNLPDAFDPDRDFDRLFADGDRFEIGALPVQVMLSPGHTLGTVTYLVGEDAALVHDTFMHVDTGTVRANFSVVWPGRFANQCRLFSHCRIGHVCSSAITTAPRSAMNRFGSRRWSNSGPTTSILVAESAKMIV